MAGVCLLQRLSVAGGGARARLSTFKHNPPQCLGQGATPGCGLSTVAQEDELVPGLRMRAWQTCSYEGVEGLTLERLRVPSVQRPGDLLVKVQATSVNPIDTAIISGYGKQVLGVMRAARQVEQGILTTSHTEFPLTVGRDFAGEVVSVGHGVEGVSVGDQVLGVVSPQGQGAHAEYVITSASNVCLMPASVSPEEAACVPYAGLTAWSAVVVSGMVTASSAPYSRVLVLGASGGVGTILCQLLAAWGAQVVGVCSTDAVELVSSLGVEALDYNDPATKDMLVADGGFNLVVNATGTEDIDYLKALKPWMGSSYVTLSPPLLSNIDNAGLATGLLQSMKKVLCENASSLSEGRAYKWAFYMPNPSALKQITRMLATHKICPVIGRVFPFSEAPEAYRHLLAGHARGKTVITVP